MLYCGDLYRCFLTTLQVPFRSLSALRPLGRIGTEEADALPSVTPMA